MEVFLGTYCSSSAKGRPAYIYKARLQEAQQKLPGAGLRGECDTELVLCWEMFKFWSSKNGDTTLGTLSVQLRFPKDHTSASVWSRDKSYALSLSSK